MDLCALRVCLAGEHSENTEGEHAWESQKVHLRAVGVVGALLKPRRGFRAAQAPAARDMFSKCSLRSRYWEDLAAPGGCGKVHNRRSQH
jgi:hypothetical protein